MDASGVPTNWVAYKEPDNSCHATNSLNRDDGEKKTLMMSKKKTHTKKHKQTNKKRRRRIVSKRRPLKTSRVSEETRDRKYRKFKKQSRRFEMAAFPTGRPVTEAQSC